MKDIPDIRVIAKTFTRSEPAPKSQLIAWICFAAVLCGFVALGAFFLRVQYQQAELAAYTTADNLARVITDHLDATLRQIDTDLRSFAELTPHEAMIAVNTPRFRKDIEARFQAESALFPEIQSRTVVNADGEILYRHGVNMGKANLADRAWFQSLRDHSDLDMTISDVVNGRATGKPTIIVSRAIRDRDGHFLGTVNASLNLSSIDGLFNALQVGKLGLIELARKEINQIVLRRPGGAAVANHRVNGALTRQVAAGIMAGRSKSVSILDGIERVRVFRVMDNYPFYVVVGIASTEYLANWRSTTYLSAAAALILIITLTALMLQRMRGEIQLTRYAASTQQSEQRLRSVFSALADGVIVIDDCGKVTDLNPGAEKIMGVTRARALGASSAPALWRYFNEDGTSLPVADYPSARTLATGHPQRNTVLRLERSDGGESWLSINTEPLFAKDSNVAAGAVVSICDITERRRNALELTRHHDHLQELVDERTAESVKARQQAENANRAKSEFLANMSHELRTPMHAILSFAELGIKRATEPDKIAGYLARIQQSGKRLLALLNDLLDLSKLEAGRMKLEPARNSLRPLIDQVAGELAALLKSRDQEVRIYGITADDRAWFDRNKIAQVLNNLLGNAGKFAPERSKIDVIYNSTTVNELMVSVRDRGPGIPPGEIDAIFDQFVQSSKTKTGAGGTGLGLAICRQIVQAHGGRIWAANNADGGASFSFTLQLAPPQAETSVRAAMSTDSAPVAGNMAQPEMQS